MAIELENSIFIHIPKTGGRWVANVLRKMGYKDIGDPIYQAHECPQVDGKPAFAFVRHPVTMLNSLWHHRARKHTNTRHKDWNWQQDHRLEKECGCPDLREFYGRVAERPGIVWEYYMEWMHYYDSFSLWKYEDLANELIRALQYYEERFDADFIRASAKQVIGGTKNPLRIMQEAPYYAYRIIANESQLYRRFGYDDFMLKRILENET